MIKLLSPFLAVFAALGLAAAQDSSISAKSDLPPLPPAPPDNILDKAGLLDPTTRAGLRDEIYRLRQASGVELFVAAYTLLSENIDERARRLRSSWGGANRCIVVVYKRGSQQLTFSANGDADEFMPTGELLRIYDDAVSAARAYEAPRERILAAVQSLTAAVIRDLAVRDSKRGVFTSEIAKLVAGLTLAVLIIGGLSLLCVRRLQRRRVARDTGLVFPELNVARRLGAPFGGGTVAEIHFAAASPAATTSSHPHPHPHR